MKKNIFKSELKKAVKNKFFALSLLISCIITLFSLVYNVNIYNNHFSEEIALVSTTISNPYYEMFSLFNHWIGGECFSSGSTIYFFVFPLLVAIPYSWSYCEEKTSGYLRMVVVRSGKTAYFLSKYAAVFVAGGLAMVLPLLFNFVSAAMFFPALKPEVIYDTAYGVFGGSLMSMLYYTKPFLYVFLYLCIDFIFGGLIACISFLFATVLKNKWIITILPFMSCLALHYARQFVYTDFTGYVKQYKEVSPLYFLRPVQSAYVASWNIILAEAAILFLTTFLITMLWERNHEIY